MTLGHDTLITVRAGRDNNVGETALPKMVSKLHSDLVFTSISTKQLALRVSKTALSHSQKSFVGVSLCSILRNLRRLYGR